jgi:hypothetical protein
MPTEESTIMIGSTSLAGVASLELGAGSPALKGGRCAREKTAKIVETENRAWRADVFPGSDENADEVIISD